MTIDFYIMKSVLNKILIVNFLAENLLILKGLN